MIRTRVAWATFAILKDFGTYVRLNDIFYGRYIIALIDFYINNNKLLKLRPKRLDSSGYCRATSTTKAEAGRTRLQLRQLVFCFCVLQRVQLVLEPRLPVLLRGAKHIHMYTKNGQSCYQNGKKVKKGRTKQSQAYVSPRNTNTEAKPSQASYV